MALKKIFESTTPTFLEPSKLWEVLENAYVVIVSSYKSTDDETLKDHQDQLNRANHLALKNLSAQSGFDWTEADGGYKHFEKSSSDVDGSEVEVEKSVTEPSVMLWTTDETKADSLKEFGRQMMIRFDQESYLWKEPQEVAVFLFQNNSNTFRLGMAKPYTDGEFWTEINNVKFVF